MQKKFTVLTCLIVTLLFSSYAIAFDIPDMHLKSESKAEDATLVVPTDSAPIKKDSRLEVFVETLLGKNIDRLPEKPEPVKE